jgi:hypothetical protein
VRLPGDGRDLPSTDFQSLKTPPNRSDQFAPPFHDRRAARLRSKSARTLFHFRRGARNAHRGFIALHYQDLCKPEFRVHEENSEHDRPADRRSEARFEPFEPSRNVASQDTPS